MTKHEKTVKRVTLLSRLAAPILQWRARRRSDRHRLDVIHRHGFDPYRVLNIPLSRIRNAYIGEKVDKAAHMGRIVPGDWDRNIAEFEHLDVWLAFQNHYLAGKPWRETAFYKRMLGLIENGTPRWGCASQADLDARYRGVDSLYAVIRQQGYRSQAQLPAAERLYLENVDEVTVSIARDGEILFEDGRHRFSIAKILDLPEIPVQVVWRHQDWHEFRESIRDHIKASGPLSSPLPHPDLSDLSPVGATNLAPIIADLESGTNTVLDLGAELGGNCHLLEDKGFSCVAADLSPAEISIATKLKTSEAKNFAIIADPWTGAFPFTRCDAALALNGYRRHCSNQSTLSRLVALLNKTNPNILYLYAPRERGGHIAGGAMSPRSFFDALIADTNLNTASLVAEFTESNLYKLER